jgi:hypothetical protein
LSGFEQQVGYAANGADDHGARKWLGFDDVSRCFHSVAIANRRATEFHDDHPLFPLT